MLPFLLDFQIGDTAIRLPSYGVLLAFSFSAGYFLALHYAKLVKAEPKHCENLFLFSILGAVVGSRLFHVLFEEPGYYWNNPEKIIAIWEGGYTFYGALILAAVLIFWYCRKHRLNFLLYGDLAAFATMLGLFTGRIGCFLAGCCWGRPTTLPWGVVFTHPHTFAPRNGIPLHPTQLYEAFGALCILFYLMWLFKRRKYDGQLFFHGLIAYSVLRFIVEYFRGDEYRGNLGGIVSYSQMVSLLILPGAIVGIVLLGRKTKRKRPRK